MRILALITVVTLLGSISGCGPAAESNTEILSQRQMLLLNEEPDGALGVLEAKEAIKANNKIVLIGRIGAGDHSPWEAGKASFMVLLL